MRRNSGRARILTLATLAVTVLGASSAVADPWRALIAAPDDASSLRPLDRFVIAWLRHDDASMNAALDDDGWSAHLRHWARARVAAERGDTADALASYAKARDAWPATLEEPASVQAIFDRDRLFLALGADDLDAARAIREKPLRAHDDPVWDALGAWATWADGDAPAAATAFDAAWAAGSTLDRRHPVFLRRALVHLDAGDPDAAATAWTAAIDVLRRPERQREALAIWDAHEDLRASVRHASERRTVLNWLVRLFRREDAQELAHAAYAIEADAVERAWLYVFVAEQMYRRREHAALDAWLARERPLRLDDEQRAELDAYPLGVRRRSGHSVGLAAAFDAVALRYPDTDRAIEALWEGAWMWELSGETETAIARYDEIRRRAPQGRWASPSALRSLWLRTTQGDAAGVLAIHEESRTSLRDGLDAAAALWLCAEADPENRAVWEARLREEHPFSPLWRPLAPPRREESIDVEDLARRIHARQSEAFARVQEHVGLGEDPAEALVDVARMAELGLVVEAETRLAAWATDNAGDTAAVADAVRLAWRWGIPEIQGRYGWILERRLRDDGPELAEAARIAAMPTPFARDVLTAAAEARVDPALVWALIRRESFYDADVVSIAGAHGLMQLIERTGKEVALERGLPEPSPYDLLAPPTNLELGIHYLAGLLDRADDDRVRALASYNAGESNGRRWQERRDPERGEAAGILVISYSETRAYVYHVARHWNRYRVLYEETLGGS